jgi:hypothetical protein
MADMRLNVGLLTGFLSVLVLVLAVRPSAAQDALHLARLTGPVVLDGTPDEPAWEEVEPLPLTMYAPIFGGTPTERTEIRVAYDRTHLYVAGWMFDSDPSGIRANSLYRDRYSGDDTFAIILDTFNDNQNALWFYTTPLGVRTDMAVSNDAEGGGGGPSMGAINNSWNTFWDVATTRTQDGWFAEMRIPFSSLGFQADGDRVEMGLSAYRYIARKGERHTFPAIPPDWERGFAKPSQARTVVLTDVESSRPVYITPYVTAGADWRPVFEGDEWSTETGFERQAGLDVKYNLTSNLTVDVTLNTDFAQVEADNQQVNLTRFSLFFPEKRQFFQERSSVFDFSFGRNDRLFHSRNIGLIGGETVQILGGGRLVGRIGLWDVGIINMQTVGENAIPAENFGVVRAKRRVLNEQSHAGFMMTSRAGDDGSWNVAYGLDGLLSLGDERYLDLKWTQSFEDGASAAFTDAGLGLVELIRRGNIGFTYKASVVYAGKAFNPGIGFISRNNYVKVNLDGQYGWRPGDASILRNYDGSVFGDVYVRNDDGTVESARLGHSWDVDFKSSASARVSLNVLYEDVLAPVYFPEETSVPAGSYTFVEGEARWELPDGALLRGQVELRAGSFFDGRRLGAELSPTWNLNRYLELSGSYSYTRLDFPDRDQSANVHLVGVRSQIGFNTRVSLNAFLQYNTAANLVAANVRFRYNIREGNDLWIVYNENLNADRFRETPALPVSGGRNVLLKYTYTFIS